METFLPFEKDNLSQIEKSGGTREVHGRQPRCSLVFRLPTCRKISGLTAESERLALLKAIVPIV